MSDQQKISKSPDCEGRSIRQTAKESLRYWERRRILYNLVLCLVCLPITLQDFGDLIDDSALRVFGTLLVIGFFAFVANVCYSAIYVPDLIFQWTPLAQVWQRLRWIPFIAGTLLACGLAYQVLYVPHPM